MKKYILTLISIFCLPWALWAQGVEKENYEWEILPLTVFPEKWTHIEDPAVFGTKTEKVAYSTATQQYVDNWYNTALTVGSQTLSGTENGQTVYKTVNDYLVSIPLKGKVEFWVRRFGASNEAEHKVPDVKVFPATKGSDGSFTVNTSPPVNTGFEEISEQLKASDEYFKLSFNVGNEYQYLAFRFDYVYAAVLKAEYALEPGTRSVKLKSVAFSSGYSNPFTANEENKATIKCKLTVENDGNVTLDEDDPAYFGMLAIMEEQGWNNYVPTDQRQTGKLPTLEPGQTSDAEIEFTFDVPDLTPNSNGIISVRIDGLTSLDGKLSNMQIGGYTNVQVKPYKGIMAITYNNSTYNPGTESAPRYIDFGLFHGEKSVAVTLKNNGVAPLEITAINAPDGVSIKELAPIPYTLDAGASLDANITISGAGQIQGPINLIFEGLGTNVIYVTGTCVPSDVAFYNFEDEKLPAGWYTTDNGSGIWEIYNNPVTDATNKKCLRQSNSTYPSSVTTGRLHFNEGDELNFQVALRSTSSGQLKLRISKDRTEWEDLVEFDRNGANGKLKFPTTSSKWELYTVKMPAGDWYVDFYGAYIYLDNVFGGAEAPLDFDLLPVSIEGSASAMVNYPVEVIAVFKNFGKDMDNFDIALLVNDEIVEEASEESFPYGDEQEFIFTYYPHEVGDQSVKVVITSPNEETAESALLTVNVAEESAEREVKFGESAGALGKTSEAVVPLNLYYNNSRSEYVYRAEDLKIDACDIVSIAYDFYSSASDPKVTKTRIWMQNTSDDNVKATYEPLDNMTLVYNFDGNDQWQNGGNASKFLRMTFKLDNPFEYTGGNLRVVIESNAGNYAQTYFSYTDCGNDIICTYKDDKEQFEAMAPVTIAGKAPVTYFGTALTPVEVTGVVQISEQSALKPVENAVVTAMAKDSDIRYIATTGTDGTYTLPILQSAREYTITATHAEYEPSASQDVDFANPVHDFILAVNTGVQGPQVAEEEGEYVLYNLHGERMVNPTPGIYIKVSGVRSEKIVIK